VIVYPITVDKCEVLPQTTLPFSSLASVTCVLNVSRHWSRMMCMAIPGNGPPIRMERYLHIIFLHIIFLETCSQFFSRACLDGKELGHRRSDLPHPWSYWPYQDRFFQWPNGFRIQIQKASHPDRKEPELTIPMVALGATAVSNAFDHNLTIANVTIQVFLQPCRNGVKGKGQRWAQTVPGHRRPRDSKATISRKSTINLVEVEKESQHVPSSHVHSLFKSREHIYLFVNNIVLTHLSLAMVTTQSIPEFSTRVVCWQY